MRRIMLLIFMAGLVLFWGCAGKEVYHKEGVDFKYEGGIVVDKTTKPEILGVYGPPVSTSYKEKYEILKYSFVEDSLKKDPSFAWNFIPHYAVYSIGKYTVNQFRDTDEDDTVKSFKLMLVYIDLTSGVVKDYFYRDSDGKGQDESETVLLEAESLLAAKKQDEAIAKLQQACSLNEKNHRAYCLLSWVYLDYGIDVQQGLEFAKKAVSIFPDSPRNNECLGLAYYKMKDFNNAKQYLSRSIDLYKIYSPNEKESIDRINAYLKIIKESA